MRLRPVLLDAERLSFARAQRTDATQHFAVLCHLHSAPMGDSGCLTEAGGKNEL